MFIFLVLFLLKYFLKLEKIRIKMFILINYNLLINIREINKRTNLGKMYFENTYTLLNVTFNITTVNRVRTDKNRVVDDKFSN